MSHLDADKPRKLSPMAQDALDIVRLAQRRGRMDMVLAEILHALRAQAPAGVVVEKPSLSRELTHLSDDGLLLRRSVKRKPTWEVLPAGKQKSWPATYAYYVPGARSAVPAALAAAADCY